MKTLPRLRSGIIKRQCSNCLETKPLPEFGYGNKLIHCFCFDCHKKTQTKKSSEAKK